MGTSAAQGREVRTESRENGRVSDGRVLNALTGAAGVASAVGGFDALVNGAGDDESVRGAECVKRVVGRPPGGRLKMLSTSDPISSTAVDFSE
jgi:hypothetical protein